MIYFDGKTFNDSAEIRRYCEDQLKQCNDGDYQARHKYDIDYDADQDWMRGR